MEWSDECAKGRESAEWSRFPSLHREVAAGCIRRRLLVGQFPVRALIRPLATLRCVLAAAPPADSMLLCIGLERLPGNEEPVHKITGSVTRAHGPECA